MAQSVFVYSVEGFPGTKENGRMHEYIRVLGHQIVLKAKRWTRLNQRYDKQIYESYMDKQGKVTTHFDNEVAEDICRVYGERGIVWMEGNPEEHKAKKMKLEAEAESLNRKWREKVIVQWERTRQRSVDERAGRFEPSPYELECYEVLGKIAPNSIQAIDRERNPQPVQVTVNVSAEEVAKKALELIAQMSDEQLAALRGKKTEEPKKPTVFEDAMKAEPVLGEFSGTAVLTTEPVVEHA